MKNKLQTGDFRALDKPRIPNLALASIGPRAAISQLNMGRWSEAERRNWTTEARLDAILGGMRYSTRSVQSGLRCYVAFVRTFPFL